MKSILAVFLSFLIVFSFVGCKKNPEQNLSSDNSYLFSQTDDTLSSAESISSSMVSPSSSKANESTVMHPAPGSTPAVVTPKPTVTEPTKTEDGNDIISDGDIKVEDVASTEEVPEQEEVPEIKEEIAVNTNHTPLSADKYYQYQSLNSKQKQVYNAVITAIKETKNIINVTEFNISREDGLLVLQKALADHPEYFYVSRHSSAMYNPETMNSTALFIYYTDGETVDKLDDDGKLTLISDRESIAKQITLFNAKAEEILKSIPANYSDVLKEKMIHDYLLDNLTYDYKSAEDLTLQFGEAMGHAWDSYGALIEGNVVCEGYSKAFAYLCHCAGLNAVTVTGEANGGAHMWNAVQIENEWYNTDVTWDDAAEIRIYSYFNLTTNQLSATHTVKTSFAVPLCTSAKHSFNNSFAIDISNGRLPENYKTMVDQVYMLGDNYLYCVINEQFGVSGGFLMTNITGKNSPVMKYVTQKGYNISFAVNKSMIYSTLLYVYIEKN